MSLECGRPNFHSSISDLPDVNQSLSCKQVPVSNSHFAFKDLSGRGFR